MTVPARLLVAALVALLAGCAASIETGAHYDESVDFSNYSTFAWIADPPYIGGDPTTRLDTAAQELIEATIRSELSGLGYAFVEDRSRADFIIAYTTGVREQIQEADYPSRFSGYASGHVPGSLHIVHADGLHTYTEETLSIDALDAGTGSPVWHGWTQNPMTNADRRDPATSIERGLRQLFAEFPEHR